jgi:uncharacterized protein (TIGR02391 family)
MLEVYINFIKYLKLKRSNMINVILDQQQLKAICDVLGHTDLGFTKSEITSLLQQCEIKLLDDGSSNNGHTYTYGLNKRNWLFNCLANELNFSQSMKKIYELIEKALNPVTFTAEKHRSKYIFLLEETNRVLLLAGLSVNNTGKLLEVKKAENLDEVDRRVSHLKKELYNRRIHDEVKKYCIKDYMRKDYFDAVFESSKGLAERVRKISGLKFDGGKLFQKAFSKSDPYIFFNNMETESEISEFTGLKELMEAIFHLVRNPTAHTPKLNWKIDETKALDILTLISFAHKYLDVCYKIPQK